MNTSMFVARTEACERSLSESVSVACSTWLLIHSTSVPFNDRFTLCSRQPRQSHFRSPWTKRIVIATDARTDIEIVKDLPRL